MEDSDEKPQSISELSKDSLSENINGRNGVASLIQVIASSTMEHDTIYSGDEPYFKQSYLRHTTFDKESLVYDKGVLDITNEQTVSYSIHDHDVDMVGNFFLRIDLPTLDVNYKWINSIGNAIIKEVKIVLGDYELVKYTGTYLQIRFEMDTTAPHLIGRCQMIGKYNSLYSLSNRAKTCYVEIPFLKSAMDQQYLPLFLSKRKPLVFNVTYRPISELVIRDDIDSLPQVGVSMRVNENVQKVSVSLYKVLQVFTTNIRTSLYYDAFKLTLYEKLLFEKNVTEILFTQIQETRLTFQSNQKMFTTTLKLHGNICELIIIMKLRVHIDNNLYFKFLPLHKINLTINNVPLTNDDTTVDINIYRLKQPHVRTPDAYIYVIPFNLSSLQTQPSGSLNFDKMSSNSKITLTRNAFVEQVADVHVYAVCYNTIYANKHTMRLQKL